MAPAGVREPLPFWCPAAKYRGSPHGSKASDCVTKRPPPPDILPPACCAFGSVSTGSFTLLAPSASLICPQVEPLILLLLWYCGVLQQNSNRNPQRTMVTVSTAMWSMRLKVRIFARIKSIFFKWRGFFFSLVLLRVKFNRLKCFFFWLILIIMLILILLTAFSSFGVHGSFEIAQTRALVQYLWSVWLFYLIFFWSAEWFKIVASNYVLRVWRALHRANRQIYLVHCETATLLFGWQWKKNLNIDLITWVDWRK